jgi:hypothetical protein
LIRSIIDLQEKIKATGTVTGKEFTRRTSSDGPRPVLNQSEGVVVAPGDYARSTRLSLN